MTSPAEARRIGGEFELGARQFGADTVRSPALPGFGNAHELWLDTGRSALAVIAAQLRKLGGDAVVWLPAYSCESVAAPFARQRLEIRFYAVGAHLQHIDAEPARGDALLFIHYFGMRNQAGLAQIEAWRARGVRVIEDCVQAALTDGVGRHGDHALTSLRKLLAQPDGALLSSRLPLEADLQPPDEDFVSARVIGKLLRGSGAAAELFLPLFDESEANLADDRPRAMSRWSRYLLARSDLAAAAARRIANFEALAKRIAALPRTAGIEPLFDALDDGEVPLGLPVVVADGRRDALRRHLMAQGIFCPVHWDLSHVAGDFAEERRLSAALLTLPIDQRYDEQDMRAIHDSLSTFIGARA